MDSAANRGLAAFPATRDIVRLLREQVGSLDFPEKEHPVSVAFPVQDQADSVDIPDHRVILDTVATQDHQDLAAFLEVDCQGIPDSVDQVYQDSLDTLVFLDSVGIRVILEFRPSLDSAG